MAKTGTGLFDARPTKAPTSMYTPSIKNIGQETAAANAAKAYKDREAEKKAFQKQQAAEGFGLDAEQQAARVSSLFNNTPNNQYQWSQIERQQYGLDNNAEQAAARAAQIDAMNRGFAPQQPSQSPSLLYTPTEQKQKADNPLSVSSLSTPAPTSAKATFGGQQTNFKPKPPVTPKPFTPTVDPNKPKAI